MKSETWARTELERLKTRIKNPRFKSIPAVDINAQTKYAMLGKIDLLEEVLEGK